MTREKVCIEITKGRYSKSVKNGAEYISVGFNAKSYGAGSPCDDEQEVKEAIKHQREWILREGDIPVVKDLRNVVKTKQSSLIMMKGGGENEFRKS